MGWILCGVPGWCKFKLVSGVVFFIWVLQPFHEYFTYIELCLFVLMFYGPVNPIGSCRAWSVYLNTPLLGRLSPLSS